MTEQTEEKPKKPRGGTRNLVSGSRPLELTPKMFFEAGRFALTWRHMSAVYGVSQDTIADRMKDPEFKQAWEHGKMASQNEVIQFLFAQMRSNGSLKAGIFLAQAWCHLSTRHEVKSEETHTTRYVVEVPQDAPTLNDWTHLHHAATNDANKAERVN